MPMPDGSSDFRSDTVTQPTAAMRAAMASAPVGDDVFGDDPSVNELQSRAAELFGKEAALFVPSGTMGNLLATKVHTRPGDEIIVEERAHMFNAEGGGAAWIAGVQIRTLLGPCGRLDPGEVRAAIRPDDPHFPRTAMLAVENTHNFYGGRVLPLEDLRGLRALTLEHGLGLHMDGARLMNAVVATGIQPAVWAAEVDTLQVCLSKGLGAPSGSLLLGDAERIHRAHRFRKALGGGMRQVGVLAAPGLIALEEGPKQMVEDHRNARRLAEGLADLEGFEVDLEACETNILFVRCESGRDEEIVAALEAAGVRAIALGALGLRFVTHRHVEAGDVDRALEIMASLAPRLAIAS